MNNGRMHWGKTSLQKSILARVTLGRICLKPKSSVGALFGHQQNMLMLQRPGRPGSTQEGWEQNSTFRSSLNTPGACQEWLGIVWRVCASSCQELRVAGRARSNLPLHDQSQAS